MKKAVLWAIVLLASLLIQTVFLSGFFNIGSKPDLFLAIVVSAGLLGGKELGLGIGFFAGLFQDLSSGNIFGLNIFPKMAIGYLLGFMESKVFKENIFLPAVAAVAGTFLNGFITFIILYILGYWTDFLFFIIHQFILVAFYNILIAIPTHRLIYRLFFYQRT